MSGYDSFFDYLTSLDVADIEVRRDVTANKLSTFAVGGSVDYLVVPRSIEGLSLFLRHSLEQSINWRVLGAGSNILLPDTGVREPVLSLPREFSGMLLIDEGEIPVTDQKEIDNISHSHQELLLRDGQDVVFRRAVEAMAQGTSVSILIFGSTPLMSLSRNISSLGLSGLEFAAGIPASLGGAVVMNAGAHGACMADVVEIVFIAKNDGTIEARTKGEVGFSYRHSGIARDEVVIAAEIRVLVADAKTVRQKRKKCLSYRKQTQPLHLPSAGSVFKNPSPEELNKDSIRGDFPDERCQQLAAAELLEKLQFKGRKVGGVAFSDLHANWLVKVDEIARADDVKALILDAQHAVMEKYALDLQSEIVIW